MKKLVFVFGTRPEIIKLSELIRIAKNSHSFDVVLVHTGQHYSDSMSDIFIEELSLPSPAYNLGAGSGSHAEQLSKMLVELEKVFLKEKPDTVVVQGDTNSVLAGALVASKLSIKVAHVEAGLRSFDRTMPEEINRILVDHLADFNFAPTKTAVANLKNEGVPDSRIFLVGNTIVEVVSNALQLAGKKSVILKDLSLNKNDYVLLTAHRAENVDNRQRLTSLVNSLSKIKLDIIFPAHPRTLKMLETFGLLEQLKAISNVKIIQPVGFLDLLNLAANSKFIITDSGGIQEEASIYKKPVLIIRDNTERPEIIGKFGWLVGCDSEKIVKKANEVLNDYSNLINGIKNLPCPFGDGKASQKILEFLK